MPPPHVGALLEGRKVEGHHDTEITKAALKCAKEVGVAGRVGLNYLTQREHDLVIDGFITHEARYGEEI